MIDALWMLAGFSVGAAVLLTVALATQAAWLAYRAGPVLRGTTVPVGVGA